MPRVSGIFATLESVERACRDLQGHGIAREQLSLSVTEACGACARAEAPPSPCTGERLRLGRGLGSSLGTALGIAAVLWPIPVAAGLFEWMMRLFVIASWSLSGWLLGGMLACTWDEAKEAIRRTRAGEPDLHAHAILTVAVSPEKAAEVRALMKRHGGRLAETPAACGTEINR